MLVVRACKPSIVDVEEFCTKLFTPFSPNSPVIAPLVNPSSTFTVVSSFDKPFPVILSLANSSNFSVVTSSAVIPVKFTSKAVLLFSFTSFISNFPASNPVPATLVSILTVPPFPNTSSTLTV